ncbi:MAG: hypothetical protein JRI68_30225 [Deltaproteobacteria bacterium]|nr:hypothetical protein [Deltaproteobacteria bacterium]
MMVRVLLVILVLVTIGCGPSRSSLRAPALPTLTLPRDQEVPVAALGGSLLYRAIEYEHGEDGSAATVVRVNLVGRPKVLRFVATMPGQTYADGVLLTVLGDDDHRLRVQIDQPVLGRPFELHEHNDVVLDGTQLQFFLDPYGLTGTPTVRFAIGVGDKAQHLDVAASPGSQGSITTPPWRITVGDVTTHSAVLLVERLARP